MERIIIECQENNEQLPAFSLEMSRNEPNALYSNADMQSQLLRFLEGEKQYTVFANEWQALYDRLTVGDHIKFYCKWFGCKWTCAEVLVRFQLHDCAKKKVGSCTISERHRIAYVKSWLAEAKLNVFVEPVHGVDVTTINVFMEMLGWMAEADRSVLILVANMEHAVLLGSRIHHLKENGLHEIEMEEPDSELAPAVQSEMEAAAANEKTRPFISNLYKIPAKTGDKVILFDPTEIDYIESQNGKVQLVLNEEHFTMDMTLAEAERKLELYGFYRCHRSYIVNLQKVREIITWSKNTYSLRLQNRAESTIPLSRTKVQEIQEIFSLK